MKAKFIGNNEAIIINGYKICDPENLELNDFRLIKLYLKFRKTEKKIKRNKSNPENFLKILIYEGERTKIDRKWVLPVKEVEYGKDGSHKKTKISLSIC